MANGNIGYSFNPSGAPQDIQTQQGSPGGGLSPQQAVKILSLRVPDHQSQGAIAPMPLLQSKGSAAPGAGGLDTLIAALMKAFQGQATAPVQRGGDNYSDQNPYGGWAGQERGLNNRPPAVTFEDKQRPDPPPPLEAPNPRITPGGDGPIGVPIHDPPTSLFDEPQQGGGLQWLTGYSGFD